MKNPATFRRTAAAVGLATTAALMVVSVIFQPEFPAGATERLAAIDVAGTGGTVSAFTFTLAQLPLLAAVLGIGHLLRERAPRLSSAGTTLGVVGAFGHSVYGGISMVYLSMASDTADRGVHADLMESVEAGPAAAFMVMGLAGTVLSLLVLSIGLWRARVDPRWAPPVLWIFLVVEFAGTSISEWASLVSVALYLAAFGGLAVTVRRSPLTAWETRSEQQPLPVALP